MLAHSGQWRQDGRPVRPSPQGMLCPRTNPAASQFPEPAGARAAEIRAIVGWTGRFWSTPVLWRFGEGRGRQKAAEGCRTPKRFAPKRVRSPMRAPVLASDSFSCVWLVRGHSIWPPEERPPPTTPTTRKHTTRNSELGTFFAPCSRRPFRVFRGPPISTFSFSQNAGATGNAGRLIFTLAVRGNLRRNISACEETDPHEVCTDCTSAATR
jgi:hypothetical protein